MSRPRTLLATLFLLATLAFPQNSNLQAAAPKAATTDTKAAANPVRLCLPPVIYAVVGDEANIYFDNVMLTVNPRNYVVDVNCPRGSQQVERWTYRPAAKIGVMLTVPPAATQDAFAVNYACGQTRWQYKRNQHRAVERLLKKYSNREKKHLRGPLRS